MLVKDNNLYAVMDAGVAVCFNCATGEERWKARLGGTFSASPVMVGDRIYAIDEGGQYAVIGIDPENFEVLARGELGGGVFGTPTICGGEIFVRVAERVKGELREMLYCFGK